MKNIKTIKEILIEEIKEIIINLLDDDKVSLHNEYCKQANYYDDRVYYYEEIDDLWLGSKPTEILAELSDVVGFDYFYFNGYGNATPLCDIEDIVSFYNISNYIIENEVNLGFDNLDEIINLISNLENIKEEIREDINFNKDESSLCYDNIIEIIDNYVSVDDYNFINQEFINQLIKESMEG